jgi:hypothetical protein
MKTLAILWQALLCGLCGHDLAPLAHPDFPGRTILCCRRCLHSGEVPARSAGGRTAR